jgi:hypothetical protein
MVAPPPPGRREPGPESSARAAFDRAFARAVREVRLLAAVTPANLATEQARLARELERGREAVPFYAYAPAMRTELRRTLEALSRRVSEVVARPLGDLYRARIEELDLEARIAEAAGTARLGRLARTRFEEKDAKVSAEAKARAREWLRIPAPRPRARIPSDASHPESLLSEMRRAVGEARLPFKIVVSEILSSRAATGERTIWVAKGRLLTKNETRRTVAHEVDGHAQPRARAASKPPIFAIGTAHGTDDQEGFALCIEEREGWLDDGRRRELAARHWVVEAMSEGAGFAEVTRSLVNDHGFAGEVALGMAHRAFRGSNGTAAGLGRESVYLGAWLRVRAHLASKPNHEETLASGQVALGAIGVLEALAPSGGA